MKKLFTKKRIKEFIFLNVGVLLVAFSFSMFMRPNDWVTGGVGGLALIIAKYISITPSIFILALDIILLIIGWIFLGRDFFIKTCYGTLIYPVYTFLWENVYNWINGDQIFKISGSTQGNIVILLVASAIITGAGLGLSMKNGGSTGGIDVIQLMMAKYLHMPISLALVFTDGLIVLAGGMVFGNYINIFYGVFFIVISGFIMDNIIFGGFNVRAVHIISPEYDKIKDRIIKDFSRTVTITDVVGGYTGESRKMVICVLQVREYYHLRTMLDEIDPTAFVYLTKAAEVKGEGFTYEKEDLVDEK